MKLLKTKNKTAHVLVIGAGEIGSRHLQALSSLKEVGKVDVVDPSEASLELSRSRLKEVSDLNTEISFDWKTSLDQVSSDGDLCLIATRAQGREGLFNAAVKKGYSSFLLEKLVTPSVESYERMVETTRKNKLNVWVNCKTRAYPFHIKAREKFREGEPIQFTLTAGNHGLATNGIHNLDLFVFYDRAKQLLGGSGSIDSIIHESKRGQGLGDLSGTLVARSEKGSTFSLTFTKEHKGPPTMVVASKEYRFVLDQFSQWAFESSAATNWKWMPVDFKGNYTISAMTKDFVGDILTKGTCALPTLEEGWISNSFLMAELKPYFEKISGKKLEELPIT